MYRDRNKLQNLDRNQIFNPFDILILLYQELPYNKIMGGAHKSLYICVYLVYRP